VQAGMYVSTPCVAAGTKVLSLDGAWARLSANATCTDSDMELATFSTKDLGCAYFHVQQDSYSLTFYETDTPLTPHIEVTLKNNPCFSQFFFGVDNAIAILRWDPIVPGTTFKGRINGISSNVVNHGYIYNHPNDGIVVFVQ